MRGDADRLRQVVWNLLSNAVKFTSDGGQVDVSLTELAGQRIQVSVRDTGIGIASEFLPFVFERFRQADSSTTRHHGGLGLGLAIVRHLVELHGGNVRAESAGRGRGATFMVDLPLPPASSIRGEDDRSRARRRSCPTRRGRRWSAGAFSPSMTMPKRASC